MKFQLGKLPLPTDPHVYLPEQRIRHGIATLAVDEETVMGIARLPKLHRDPFDRLLVSQAIQHGLTLVTVDKIMKSYPVPSLS